MQFGHHPRTDVARIDPRFARVDGRGRADVDWTDYHRSYIDLWDHRMDHIVQIDDGAEDRPTTIRRYLAWFRSRKNNERRNTYCYSWRKEDETRLEFWEMEKK